MNKLSHRIIFGINNALLIVYKLKMKTEGIEISRQDINLLMAVLFEVKMNTAQNQDELESLRKKIGLCWSYMSPFKMMFVPTEHFSEWFNTQQPKEEDD